MRCAPAGHWPPFIAITQHNIDEIVVLDFKIYPTVYTVSTLTLIQTNRYAS